MTSVVPFSPRRVMVPLDVCHRDRRVKRHALRDPGRGPVGGAPLLHQGHLLHIAGPVSSVRSILQHDLRLRRGRPRLLMMIVGIGLRRGAVRECRQSSASSGRVGRDGASAQPRPPTNRLHRVGGGNGATFVLELLQVGAERLDHTQLKYTTS